MIFMERLDLLAGQTGYSFRTSTCETDAAHKVLVRVPCEMGSATASPVFGTLVTRRLLVEDVVLIQRRTARRGARIHLSRSTVILYGLVLDAVGETQQRRW